MHMRSSQEEPRTVLGTMTSDLLLHEREGGGKELRLPAGHTEAPGHRIRLGPVHLPLEILARVPRITRRCEPEHRSWRVDLSVRSWEFRSDYPKSPLGGDGLFHLNERRLFPFSLNTCSLLPESSPGFFSRWRNEVQDFEGFLQMDTTSDRGRQRLLIPRGGMHVLA